MSCAELSLDIRSLPAATRDSCGRLSPLLCDFVERPPVAVERCLLSAQRLPPGNYDVDILRIELYADTNALRQFGGGECSARSEEWVIYQLSSLGVIQDRTPHEFDGLLRRVIELLLVRAAHNKFRRRRCPNRRILAWLPIPWRILLSNKPAWLMLKPIQRTRQNCSTLVPDDLLVMVEPDAQKAIKHLAGEFACVPDVRDL